MFSGCKSLTRVDFTGWHPTQVRGLNYVFHNCNSLLSVNFDDSSWGVTGGSYPASFYHTFHNCSMLTSFSFNFLNDTSSISSLTYAFYGCNNLKSIDISKLTGQDISYLEYTFYRCYSLKDLDLSGTK